MSTPTVRDRWVMLATFVLVLLFAGGVWAYFTYSAPEPKSLMADIVQGYIAEGNQLYARGEYDQAIESYNKAIKRQSDSAQAFLQRGLAYRDKGDNNAAASDFRRVLVLTADPQLRQLAQEGLRQVGGE